MNAMNCKNLRKKLLENSLPVEFRSSKFHQTSKRRKKRKNPKMIERINEIISKLFNKKKEINNEDCQLPHVSELYTESAWQVEELQTLKIQLNEVKSKLNNYDLSYWKYHTRQRNIANAIKLRVNRIINPEFPTQAWCKFYECLSKYSLIPEIAINRNKLKTIHLCEAPGAFITALNHFIKLNNPTIEWDWTATTLNPYYEGNSPLIMLDDTQFISHTLDHWDFGTDYTGNLMNLNNLDQLVERERNNKEDIFLITADGSIDCSSNPDEQEPIVSHLHFCETVAAFHLLQENGNFLIKLFTIYEYKTICLVYLLTCCFKELSVLKPASSKEGNSEVYLICLGFKGPDFIGPYLPILRKYYESDTDMAIFPKRFIPKSFIDDIINIGNFFKNIQSEVIYDNISTYDKSVDSDLKYISKSIAKFFIQINRIKKIPHEMKIFFSIFELKSDKNNFKIKYFNNSYNEKQKFNQLDLKNKLLILSQHIDFYHDSVTCGQHVVGGQYIALDIKIIIGAQYSRVMSSRVCNSQVLSIFNMILDIKNQLELKWEMDLQSNEIKNHSAKEKTKVITFDYFLNDNSALKKLLSALIDLPKDYNIVLIGYPSLTQFHLGILHILHKTFKKISISIEKFEMSVITLEKYIAVPEIINHLNDIVAKSERIKSDRKMIISVLRNIEQYEKDPIVHMNTNNINTIIHQIRLQVEESD